MIEVKVTEGVFRYQEDSGRWVFFRYGSNQPSKFPKRWKRILASMK